MIHIVQVTFAQGLGQITSIIGFGVEHGLYEDVKKHGIYEGKLKVVSAAIYVQGQHHWSCS